jgi:hypothetical protein
MKKLILCIISINLLLFTSCIKTSAQERKAVFLDQILIDDKLETLLSKGIVQSTGGANANIPYDWELGNHYIKRYFTKTGVEFDNKKQIKEIWLQCSNRGGSRDYEAPKKAMNYMMKYFTGKYSSYSEKKYKSKSETSCLYKEGKEYKWNTDKISISLKYYDVLHDENVCSKIPKSLLICPAPDFGCGKYTVVTITRK